MSNSHPYSDLPRAAFWKTAVADRHIADMEDLSSRIPLRRADRVATAGSCFAQHIGARLAASGANYLDYEPAPDGWRDEDARRHGFKVYSCRYGNIYTVRQLLQLAQEALGETERKPIIWTRDGRFYDALRPSVDPAGHAKAEDVAALREVHLRQVRRLLSDLDVLVFTLGLTEAWVDTGEGVVLPTAPGTIAGSFDPSVHTFHNFRYPEIASDLEEFWRLVKRVNASARLILTVSPIPLTATASGEHVLQATTYSKSVLRAVAGDFAADQADVYYFPSFEIISSPASAGFFFNPDRRTVNPLGVEVVMKHFMRSLDGFDAATEVDVGDGHDLAEICDEGKLEQYAAG